MGDYGKARCQETQLRLLRGFHLAVGDERVELTPAGERLIAFLALQSRPVSRRYVANCLWLDASEERATANLRALLWRSPQLADTAIDQRQHELSLKSSVRVDIRDATAQAKRLIQHGGTTNEADLDPDVLAGELLPEWYDDWVLLERERVRQLRLHALDALCDRFLGNGEFARAIDVAYVALADEPFRETTHIALIQSFIAEGNRQEALRHFAQYERWLGAQLGLRPSEKCRRIIDSITSEPNMAGLPLVSAS